MPGRGRQSAALNRMSLPGEPAGRGRKAGRHRMCHPRRSVRQRNEVKEPRSGARTASPCPAPECVVTCRLTDWHQENLPGFSDLKTRNFSASALSECRFSLHCAQSGCSQRRGSVARSDRGTPAPANRTPQSYPDAETPLCSTRHAQSPFHG